jgi:hypothetical protein
MIVILLVILLPFLLLITVNDLGLTETFTNPTQIKKIVADSGLYKNIVSAVLDQAAKNSGGGNNSVSLADQAVKSAAVTTFSPQFVQQSTENVINGTYDWLNGKVSQPDFRIDLSGKKTEFASLVASNAQQVASNLPKCTRAQSEVINNQGGNFDVFSAICLPTGSTPELVASNVQAQLANNQNFLKNTLITANSINKSGSSNQTVFTGKLKKVPMIYHWLKRTPFILSLLVVLIVAGVIFISSNRLKGLRLAGIVITVMGAITLIYSWSVNYAITKKILPRINISNLTIKTDVQSIAIRTTHTVDKYYWIFGGIYLALGVCAIILAWKYYRSPKTNSQITAKKYDNLQKDNKLEPIPDRIEPKRFKVVL